MLPSNPGFRTGIIIAITPKRELVLWIILSSQIAQNSISFKYSKVIVIMVYQHWDTTIRVDSCEPWLLLNLFANIDALDRVFHAIRIAELFEKDLGFETVGCAPAEKFDALGGDETSWSGH